MANNINIVITATDKASKPIRGVGEEMDGTSKKAALFGNALRVAGRVAVTAGAAGFAAVTAGALSASKASFEQVKAVEEARYGLQAYEKDGRKVNQVLGDLVSYAKSDAGVLFNRADLFAAASTLKMYGNETDTLTERVKVLSKGVAQGKTTFQELSAIVGRAAAKGRLDAVDFDMLIERGIGIDRKFRGATISADNLWKALNEALPDATLAGRADTIDGKMIRLQSAFRGVGDAILGVDSKTNKFIKGGLGDRFMQGIEDNTKLLKDLAPIIGAVVTGILDFTDSLSAGAIGAVKWLNDELGKVPAAVREATGWMKERFDDAKDAVSGAFNEIKERGRETWDALTGWVEENETAIRWVSTVLGIVFGPALVRATVLAGVSAVKIAASGVVAGGGWVLGAAKATGAWVVASARWVIVSAVASAKMVAHAAATGWAHSIQAIKSSAAWTLNFGRMVLVSSVSGTKMAFHAADVGWAWVFNATRASTAWVVKELPRIVAASSVTAVTASRHAIAVGAVWVASASRAAFAWVVTELPRIVAAFAVTSASATAHAVVASAAWIASAVKSAFVWVVTELPKIVAAFAVTSGAAAAHAALASGSWVASAVTSTEAFVAFKALVATPIVMPAIVIGAAILAIQQVWQAYQDTMNAIKQGEEQLKQSQSVTKTIQDKYYAAKASGNKAETDKYFKMYMNALDSDISILNQQANNKPKSIWNSGLLNRNAAGTNNSPGGWSLINEHGPEIVNLPQGSSVTPAYRSRNALGSGSGVNIENLTYHVYNQMDEKRALRDLGFQLELAS